MEQLNELIETLSSTDHKIYVNVDKKSDLDISKINNKANLIKKRINIEWGRFSQVKATLISLQEIIKEENKFEHVVFISGQDFPMRPNEVIDQTLLQGKEYLRYSLSTEDGWKFAPRYERFHFGNSSLQKNLSSILYRRLMKPLNWKRRYPKNYTPYAGAQWWMLTRDCILYILNFVKTQKRYVQFHGFVNCSDEIFFQTIVLNSPFSNDVVNNCLHYVDWSESKKSKTGSPNVLGLEDYDKIMASDNLFCRKIDYPQSRELVEKIKESILSSSGSN